MAVVKRRNMIAYKPLVVGSFLLTLLFGAVVPVRAQAPDPAETAPAPQTQEAPKTEVSSEELQKFVNVVKQVQTIQQSYEGRMAQAVQGVGLSQERFMEIHQSQKNPSAQPSSQVSEEEMQNYEQANAQVSKLQQEAETEMQKALQTEGLNIERFNEIFVAIQQDQSLQQQVQQMLRK
jgi:uncharacterized membrane protein